MTLLHAAMYCGADEAALALLDLGADVNALYRHRNIARTPQLMLRVELPVLGDEHTRLRLERCLGTLHWQDTSALDLAETAAAGRHGPSEVVDALLARGAKTAAQLGGGSGEEDCRASGHTR